MWKEAIFPCTHHTEKIEIQVSDIYRSPIPSFLQETLPVYCHSFLQDTLSFSSQPGGMFAFLFFRQFST